MKTGIIILICFFPMRGFSQIVFYFYDSVRVFQEGKELSDPWGGGLNSGQFGMVDVNGDGMEDLLVYDRSSNQLKPFLYAGGVFKYEPGFRSFFPDDIENWILLKDYNGDGRKDIFTDADQGMRVFRNVTQDHSGVEWERIADPVLTLSTSGKINLQVNYTDIPSIDDIDGDGDLDILVYNFAIGGYIRHHKNMSFELTGTLDELDYLFYNRDWGRFEECDCYLFAFNVLGETCQSLSGNRVMHPGGKALLIIDTDGDGDMDFLGGHEQCNELYFFENVGTADSAVMISFSASFPDPENPANFPVFPAGYYDDFDQDGDNDLVVALNDPYNFEKMEDLNHSGWLYQNTSSAGPPRFELVTKGFIQENMIDVGENATPVFFDLDQDGDLDLLVGGNGKKIGENYFGYCSYFENIGSGFKPEFVLKNNDFLGLSNLKWYDMLLTVTDIDHNGSGDLLVSGTDPGTGKILHRFFLNQSPSRAPSVFDTTQYLVLNVDLLLNDTPCFIDVDLDGLSDLLIGKNSGRLEYYRNTGIPSTPFFALEDISFLDIDDSYVEFRRNLVPVTADFDADGTADLITSDYTGEFRIYYDFRNQVDRDSVFLFNRITNTGEGFSFGYHAWLTSGYLFNDTRPALMVGQISGGVYLLRQPGREEVPDEGNLGFSIYPNPLKADYILKVKPNTDGLVKIFNTLGQPVSRTVEVKAFRISEIDLSFLSQGYYIVKMTDKNNRKKSLNLIILR